MKKQNRNILIGLLFILASIILILSPMGYFGELNFFKLTLGIILAYYFFSNLIRKRIFESVFSLAFIVILYSEELSIAYIKNSTILLSALFFSLGLSLIVKNQKRINIKKHFDLDEDDLEDNSDSKKWDYKYKKPNYYQEYNSDYIFINNSFTSSNHYIKSKGLKKIELKASFGDSNLYLDEATIGESAIIKMKVTFSKVRLYIPKDINVYIDLESPLSNIQEENKNTGQGKEEILIIGNLTLSNLEIIYV